MSRARVLRTAIAVGLAALVTGPIGADVGSPPALRGVGVDERPGEALPLATPFRDQLGREVTLGSAFDDGRRPVLLVFGYLGCRMLCPLTLDGTVGSVMASSWRPERDFRFVFVSLDPDDAPEGLRRRLAALAEDHPGFSGTFLTGAPEAVAAVTSAAGYRYRVDRESEQIAHPAASFAIMPDGRIATAVYGFAPPPAEIEAALATAAAGQTSRSLEAVLVQCFRFTPSLQRHAGTIAGFLKVGAGLILAGFAGVLIVGLQRRPDWEAE